MQLSDQASGDVNRPAAEARPTRKWAQTFLSPLQLAHSHSGHVCRRCTHGAIYAMKDKERVTSQQLKALDEALAVYIYVFPDALAASCLKVAGCPELKMQFSRLIKNMRETGTWEPIVMATKARAAPALAFHFADELMDGCQALPVPRPPVEHTAKDMHSRCDRFGDGEAYGQHGPKGMYREGIKLYTTLIAAGTVSPALASRELEGMGIRVSAWTLGQRAKEQPGKSPTSVRHPGCLSTCRSNCTRK